MKNQSAQHFDKWVEIGASDVVLGWIQNGVKLPIHDNIESFEIPYKTQAECVFIRSELKSLLLLYRIEVCESKPRFFHIPVNSEHQELLGFSFEQK